MGYYSAKKGNPASFERVKDKYLTILFICGIEKQNKKKQIIARNKLTEKEIRLVVNRGKGWEEERE